MFVQPRPSAPEADTPASDELSRAGRTVRLAIAAAVAVITVAGTAVGDDHDFPFGPFRMYATRDDPNGVVRIVAVESIDADGHTDDLTSASGAPRRAELEGRMSELRADCGQFARLIPRYKPGPGTTAVRLVERDYPLHSGRAQMRRDDIVCSIAWTKR